MSSITILKPRVDTVNINPNPVNQNKSFIISIKVSEEYVIIEQAKIYCGMFIVGQELGGVS